MKSKIAIVFVVVNLLVGCMVETAFAIPLTLTTTTSRVIYSGIDNWGLTLTHNLLNFNTSTDSIVSAHLSFTIIDDNTNEQFGDFTIIDMGNQASWFYNDADFDSGHYSYTFDPAAHLWQGFTGQLDYIFDKSEGMISFDPPVFGAWSIMDITTTLLVDRVTPVPEPASIILFATGLAGFAGIRINRRRALTC